MKNASMTALISTFARAYHADQNKVKIFDDGLARQLLSQQEYDDISRNMAQGIAFFQPGFQGTEEEALRCVVDHQLSPTPLGRAAFAEQALELSVKLGARQYLLMAAGYDTFAYRQPAWAKELAIFEIDHPATASDKQRRIASSAWRKPGNLNCIPADFNETDWFSGLLECPSFDSGAASFCSMLGISYYLTPDRFRQLLASLANQMPSGSSLAFDYPDGDALSDFAGDRARKQAMMAYRAGEPFLAAYREADMEKLLEDGGWLMYRLLTPDDITRELFETYNQSRPANPMTAFDNVNYCLAVKK